MRLSLTIRRTLVATGGIILLVVLAAVFYRLGVFHLYYPDSRAEPVRGIDISHHQGVIDWTSLSEQGVRFAYLKASEGGDWRDPSFEQNLRDAQKHGIIAGGYHYFTLCTPGWIQAQNFMHAVPRLPAPSLPPAVDLEHLGNCGERPSREAFARQLHAYLHGMEMRYHRTPVLYTTHRFYEQYLDGDEFKAYPFWLRDLFVKPSWATGHRLVFHQYANNERYRGIRGATDANVFMGSPQEFEAFISTREVNP